MRRAERDVSGKAIWGQCVPFKEGDAISTSLEEHGTGVSLPADFAGGFSANNCIPISDSF